MSEEEKPNLFVVVYKDNEAYIYRAPLAQVKEETISDLKEYCDHGDIAKIYDISGVEPVLKLRKTDKVEEF